MGTRHGEKKYEVLLNREEMIKAESIDGYFRVSPDNRNLNYENYFEKGDRPLSTKNEYNSDNTKQLNRSEMVDLLMKLDFINHHLNN